MRTERKRERERSRGEVGVWGGRALWRARKLWAISLNLTLSLLSHHIRFKPETLIFPQFFFLVFSILVFFFCYAAQYGLYIAFTFIRSFVHCIMIYRYGCCVCVCLVEPLLSLASIVDWSSTYLYFRIESNRTESYTWLFSESYLPLHNVLWANEERNKNAPNIFR